MSDHCNLCGTVHGITGCPTFAASFPITNHPLPCPSCATLRAEVERLKAENEAFMALPTWADVTLARLAGAEAALRYCWVEDYTEDDIQRGLQAINQQASAHPGDCEPSNQEPERP